MKDLKKIEKFLIFDVAADLGKQSLDPDEDLLEQRVIDSLGIMKLVSFLEDSWNIQITDEDIVPENFQTLTTIADFIDRKTYSAPRNNSEEQDHDAGKPPVHAVKAQENAGLLLPAENVAPACITND